ncbi:MAG: hypothetical protein HC892_21340 [Saprospiraceae bacterium]|nr:hypothetical protein [Saprospiraceae bacterium]
MSTKYAIIVARQVVNNFTNSKSTKLLFAFFVAFLVLALWVGEQERQHHQTLAQHYSQEVRERWEASPDKHPHRMAHYGYVAFREKYPLSFFDFGMDAYTGKSVFWKHINKIRLIFRKQDTPAVCCGLGKFRQQ